MSDITEKRYRILVAEKDPITARTIGLTLADAGYEVLQTAKNARDAVEIALRERPDLALVDMEMDGGDVAASLRAVRDLPLVCVASFIDNASLEGIAELDPYGYLVKPFRDIEVLATVEIALRRRSMEKKLERQALELQEYLRLQNCMYSLARLSEIRFDSPDEFLANIAGVVEASCFSPGNNCVRVSLFGKEFLSENYRRGGLGSVGDVVIRGRKVGEVEVCYDEGPVSAAGVRGGDDYCGHGIPVDMVAGAIGRIVERAESEKLLKEVADLLNAFIQSAPVAIDINAPDGTTLVWNPAAERLFGWTAREAIGRFNPMVPPDRREEYFGLLNDIFRGRSHAMVEVTRHRKDGTPVEISLSTAPVRNARGETVAAMGIVTDISERKRMERMLAESEWKFRSVFEKSPIGIGLIDRHGAIIQTNQAFRQMLGYSDDELRDMTYMELTAEEDRAREADLMERFKEDRESFYTMEKCLLKKSGEKIWVHLTASIVVDREGRREFGLGMVKDITDRKKTEFEFARSREELRLLSAHLQDMIEWERKTIAREIHDDLGQVLFMLKMEVGQVRSALEESGNLLSGRMIGITKKIDRVLKKVRDITTLLRPEVLDELGLVAAIRWQAGVFTRRTGIRCALDLPASPLALDEAREIALFRIFQEALTNVVRHANAQSVEVGLRVEGDSAILTVHDDGKGIRADKTAKPRSFGLTGMRERAIACGGSFSIKGRRNRGTVVETRVPVSGGPGRKEDGAKAL